MKFHLDGGSNPMPRKDAVTFKSELGTQHRLNDALLGNAAHGVV
jgi:hypothetical protein